MTLLPSRMKCLKQAFNTSSFYVMALADSGSWNWRIPFINDRLGEILKLPSWTHMVEFQIFRFPVFHIFTRAGSKLWRRVRTQALAAKFATALVSHLPKELPKATSSGKMSAAPWLPPSTPRRWQTVRLYFDFQRCKFRWIFRLSFGFGFSSVGRKNVTGTGSSKIDRHISESFRPTKRVAFGIGSDFEKRKSTHK